MMRLAASGVTIVAVDVLSGWVCLKQGKLPGWQTISVSIPGKAPSTSLRVSSEGGEWGNNAAIYSANPAFFCFSSPDRWSLKLLQHRLQYAQHTLAFQSRILRRIGKLDVGHLDSRQCVSSQEFCLPTFIIAMPHVLIVWLLTHSDAVIRMWSYAMLIVRLGWLAGC